MNGFVKRLVTLKGGGHSDNSSIGFVKAFCSSGTTNLDFTLPNGFLLADKTLFIGNGEKFLTQELKKNLDAVLDIENALIVAVFLNGELLFYGSSGKSVTKNEVVEFYLAFLEFEKQQNLLEPKAQDDQLDATNAKTEPSSENKHDEFLGVYDDEAIAQENYFEFEKENGKEPRSDFDAKIEEQNKSDQENKGSGENQREDDADLISFEKREKSGKLKTLVENALLENEPFLELRSVIPFGKFCKVLKDGKHFILGEVEAFETAYFVLGVESKKDAIPEKFLGLSFFVPKSLFRKDGFGFHFLIYSQKDEKIIKPNTAIF